MRFVGLSAVLAVAGCGRIGFDDGARPDAFDPGSSRVELIAGVLDPAGHLDGRGTSARLSYPEELALAGNALYVTDSGSGTIRKIDLVTLDVTTIAGIPWSFETNDGVAGRFDSVAGITVLGNQLYVTDYSADTIRAIDLSTKNVTTIAGSPYMAGGDDGVGASATFYQPVSITNDGTMLYVAEWEGNRIRQIDLSTRTVTLVAGGGGFGSADGTGAAAQFDYPSQIEWDASTNTLLVADTWNTAIRRVTRTGVVTTLVTTDVMVGGVAAVGTDLMLTDAYEVSRFQASTLENHSGMRWSRGAMDGVATNARFSEASSILSDGQVLYVADTKNSLVRRVDASGAVTTIAGFYTPVDGIAEGVGTAARFDQINSIASDGRVIWIADENNHTIRELDLTTRTTDVVAGEPGSWGIDDGIGAAARFHRPSGITYAAGLVYIVDRDSTRLRRFDPKTRAVTTIGDPNALDGPGDVVFANGAAFIADRAGHQIVHVNVQTGASQVLAGMRGQSGWADGIGGQARFNSPTSITYCPDDGFLYVADEYNATVRRVDPTTGAVTTLAGDTSSYEDGPFETAQFADPYALTCEGSSLYLAERWASTIRKLDLVTRQVSTFLGKRSVQEDRDDAVGNATFNQPIDLVWVGGVLYVAGQTNVRRVR